MRFEEVLPALREGKKIRRNEWYSPKFHYFLHEHGEDNEIGLYYKLDISPTTLASSMEGIELRDILADDWEILE